MAGASRTSRSRTATLVLLSWNEAEALQKLLPQIDFELFDEVMAVDAGSSDGTPELYAARGIRCVTQERHGRGEAMRLGERLAQTDDVVFFSSDGNEDPADLPRILDELEAGHDLVICGRFVLPGSCVDLSDDPLRLRQLGSMTFSLLARWIWGAKVWDACNGYRGFRVEAMRKLKLDSVYNDIEYQSTIRAQKLGLRIREIPTRELLRMGGEHKPSATTWRLGWRTGRCLLREIWLGSRIS